MKQEEISTFSRKIAASNASGLIEVLYDIYFTYENEALMALEKADWNEYLNSLRKASQVIEHLKNTLDFKYDIAKELYPLYNFAEVSLSKAIYSRDKQYILNAREVMRPLQEAFVEVAKVDKSKPLMENTQQVTAGLTYGRNNLTESLGAEEPRRGFWI
ncbi:MAG: flagellar protein FliS [Lachnospiraceae bacterium]|nr:flagellar protein FliS [Lachnospiraceae bacterium]